VDRIVYNFYRYFATKQAI